MNKSADTDTVVWYRQFWPWFLIALPGAVVISSVLYAYLAVKNQDPIVDGNYYKHGLTINEQLNDKLPDPAKPAATQDAPH